MRLIRNCKLYENLEILCLLKILLGNRVHNIWFIEFFKNDVSKTFSKCNFVVYLQIRQVSVYSFVNVDNVSAVTTLMKCNIVYITNWNYNMQK